MCFGGNRITFWITVQEAYIRFTIAFMLICTEQILVRGSAAICNYIIADVSGCLCKGWHKDQAESLTANVGYDSIIAARDDLLPFWLLCASSLSPCPTLLRHLDSQYSCYYLYIFCCAKGKKAQNLIVAHEYCIDQHSCLWSD